MLALTLGPPLDLSQGWRYAPENWWRDVSSLVFPESIVASESPLPLPLSPAIPPERKVVTSPVLKFIEVTSVRKSSYTNEVELVEPEEVAPSPSSEQTVLISFAFDSAKLSSDARQSLDRAAEHMQQSEASSALIAGYSDSEGNATYNRQLSQKRATAAADYLISKGVQEDRLEVEGRGIYDDPDGSEPPGATEVAERARIVQIVIRDLGL